MDRDLHDKWADRAHEFLAYYRYGFSTQEIAEMFGVESKGTVAEMIMEIQQDEGIRRVYNEIGADRRRCSSNDRGRVVPLEAN